MKNAWKFRGENYERTQFLKEYFFIIILNEIHVNLLILLMLNARFNFHNILFNFNDKVGDIARFFGSSGLAIDDMRVSVVFVQRLDNVVEGWNARSALFIPPLVAAPDLFLWRIVVPFNKLLEHERLA